MVYLCPDAGLTSRPSLAAGHQPNPYTLGAQAHLMLSLCQALGLTRVVIAAHADGCLLALRAASMSIRCATKPSSRAAFGGDSVQRSGACYRDACGTGTRSQP